ncbi:MATE family efflux transporter [Acetohalobium arabaticum]|uniref:MATE efflux family protein n=1 Tax=Acetohalobium arabaticum (strain ATCC 49924 / DSM 5501 / Z-7288) TaxID=574087 RepID=D9QPU2_ACEAZ|nr:MATE family efflux transporter [Acetohalobium arabaticum]ADL12533.1 MATE efflux family protein [Acetohalobium arabaticum DSM 5501]
MELTEDSDRLGNEPIIPLLFKLSVPSIIGMVIQALYNVIDSIYIGHLSKEALSALSLVFPLQMILIAVAVGTGVGTSSLISRLLGEEEDDEANSAAQHTVLLIIFYGMVAILIGIFFSRGLLRLFTSNNTLIDLGSSYIRIILIGSWAVFFPIVADNILRGEGNTYAPMWTMIIGALLNIALDPFLIFGIGIFPQLGIRGAAYATVISRFISGIFIGYILFKSERQFNFNPKTFEFDFSIIHEIYQVGLPAMVMQLLTSFMIIGINKIVAGYSIAAVAVVGVYHRLQTFVFMPVFGLDQGYMPIVGYNYGHENPDRMKKTIRYGLIIGFLFTSLGGVIFQLFPRELISLFNNDPALLDIGETALKRISFAFPIMGLVIVASTTFQAIGEGIPSLVLSFLRQILLLLPIMYLLGRLYGLSALWYAFPISELITVILMAFWLASTLQEAYQELATEN